MGSLSPASISCFCMFSTFVYYQQLHARDFRGESQLFLFALSIFAFVGMVVEVGYLVYYGWHVVWWAPFAILAISLVVGRVAFFVEKAVGALAISLAGFVIWPVFAYLMFRYIPSGI